MRIFKKNDKGFTLIEVMLVLAIIAILTAIAVPQFAAYRMRAFNSSAQSDLRNLKSTEEMILGDWQAYGVSENFAMLPGLGGNFGVGIALLGPVGNSTNTNIGGLLSTTDAQGVARGVGIGISNNVTIRADVGNANFASYIIYSHHTLGHREYATESNASSLYVCQNSNWIGVSGLNSTPAAASTASANDLVGVNCGGLTAPVWSAL